MPYCTINQLTSNLRLFLTCSCMHNSIHFRRIDLLKKTVGEDYKEDLPNINKVEYILLETGASKAHTSLQKLRSDPAKN